MVVEGLLLVDGLSLADVLLTLVGLAVRLKRPGAMTLLVWYVVAPKQTASCAAHQDTRKMSILVAQSRISTPTKNGLAATHVRKYVSTEQSRGKCRFDPLKALDSSRCI